MSNQLKNQGRNSGGAQSNVSAHLTHSKHEVSVTTNNNPLPSAAETQKFEELHPGFIERMFNMADDERKRRNDRDDKLVDSHIQATKADIVTIRTAQWMIFTLIIAFMSLITLGVINGYGDKIVIPGTAAIIMAGIYALIGKKKGLDDADRQK